MPCQTKTRDTDGRFTRKQRDHYKYKAGTKIRKAPIESATSLPEGTIKQSWVIKRVSNGPRWIPVVSAELNGFRRLTVDYVAKHVGRPITLYGREYKSTWPTKSEWLNPDTSHFTAKFVPNGDAFSGKTKLNGWLKSRTPEIKKGTHFYVDGPVSICRKGQCDETFHGIQVDSNNKKLMSSNFMNQEVFVKV